MILKVITRNYYWECGDGCCQESRRTYGLIKDNNVFYVEEVYFDPAHTKEEFLAEIKHPDNQQAKTLLKAIKTEFDIPDNITLVEVLDELGFEFIHTTDEYDNY